MCYGGRNMECELGQMSLNRMHEIWVRQQALFAHINMTTRTAASEVVVYLYNTSDVMRISDLLSLHGRIVHIYMH